MVEEKGPPKLTGHEEQEGQQQQRGALQHDTPTHQHIRPPGIMFRLSEGDHPSEQNPERGQQGKTDEDDENEAHS